MEHEPTVDHPPGRRLRWIAEHVASRATRERVLFPLLADLQFEHAKARSRWARGFVSDRGILAFWLAFGVTAASDSAHHLWANAWGTTEEEARITKNLLARAGVSSVICTLVLLAVGDWHFLKCFSVANLAAIVPSLVPSMIEVTIPVGLLFAIAVGDWPLGASKRGGRSVTVLATLVTFAIGAWLVPVANQAHRETVVRILAPEFTGPLARGDRELSFDELAVRSSELRSTGHEKEAGRFQLEWHKKAALGVACLAFALAGMAIASILRRRFWRLGAALVVQGLAFAMLRVGEQAADAGGLAPAAAMWGPFLIVAALSLAVLRISQRRLARAANP